MVDALRFWALAELAGLIALPVAASLFSGLPTRGLWCARPLGLLLVTYPVWLLASLDLAPYGEGTAWLGLSVAAGIGAAVLWRVRHRQPFVVRWNERLRLFVVGEAIFAAAFFGWALMRSFSPAVWDAEKPMDMAFVNAINRSETFPPHDPWSAGDDLNYYYYGHYVVAFLARIGGVEATVAFNLGLALVFALTSVVVFGIASDLDLTFRRPPEASLGRLVAPGFVAVAFCLLLGNLEGASEFRRSLGSLESYDWWGPSRVIAETANEFPLFSFLLGDLHAHVLVLPFWLAATALALQLVVARPRLSPLEVGSAALLVGALYPLNSLSYATALALLAGAILLAVLRAHDRRERLRTTAWGLAVAGGSVVLFLPFWLSFEPEAGGIGLVRDRDSFTRFLRDHAVIYLLPLWVLGPFAFARFRQVGIARRHWVWAGVAGVVLLVLLAPFDLAGLALGLALLALAAHAAVATTRPATRALWLLVTAGIASALVGEAAYIKDGFDGTEFFRFNTIFKFGFHAWFLLTIAAAVALFLPGAHRRPRLWSAGLLALVVAAALYPVGASYSRSQRFSPSPSLDGLAWLHQRAPRDAAAIRWLRASVPGAPTILEAVGDDFSPEGHGRVSVYTGLPTVMGWEGHELQWGHDPGTRRSDVKTIYEVADSERARELLARYDVEFVFVGALERTTYPDADFSKFARLGREVFSVGATKIYRLSEESPS